MGKKNNIKNKFKNKFKNRFENKMIEIITLKLKQQNLKN